MHNFKVHDIIRLVCKSFVLGVGRFGFVSNVDDGIGVVFGEFPSIGGGISNW